jgi:hypothetical protein
MAGLACTTASQLSPQAPVVWSPSLHLDSLDAIPARLDAPFPEPVAVAALGPDRSLKQATIASCAGYFQLRPKGYEPLAEPDRAAMKMDAATCWALEALAEARPAKMRPLRPFPVAQETLARLPPTLGPMAMPLDRDRRSQAARAGKSWSAADPDARAVQTDDWDAQVKGTDWTTDLHILARGDLDGDGADDLLVETVSTGSEGSWSEVRLRLLTSVPGDPVLRVVKDYPL